MDPQEMGSKGVTYTLVVPQKPLGREYFVPPTVRTLKFEFLVYKLYKVLDEHTEGLLNS